VLLVLERPIRAQIVGAHGLVWLGSGWLRYRSSGDATTSTEAREQPGFSEGQEHQLDGRRKATAEAT